MKVCESTNENSDLYLNCPESTLFSVINFASFGNSTSSCEQPSYGLCHAGSSKYQIQQSCLGKNSCVVLASDQLFGDPCYGTLKNLIVQATCS